jgi:hypothetical protein
MPEQAEAAAALRETEAAIVADLGGDVSSVALGVVRRHCRMEMVDEYLWRNLQSNGPLTGKGASRAALTSWLQLQDRLHRSAVLLGLQRRTRRLTFAEQLHEAAAGANERDDDDDDN